MKALMPALALLLGNELEIISLNLSRAMHTTILPLVGAPIVGYEIFGRIEVFPTLT